MWEQFKNEQLKPDQIKNMAFSWQLLIYGFILFMIGLFFVGFVFSLIQGTAIGGQILAIEQATDRKGFGLITYALFFVYLLLTTPLTVYVVHRFPNRVREPKGLHRPVSPKIIVLVLTIVILGPAIVALVYEYVKNLGT